MSPRSPVATPASTTDRSRRLIFPFMSGVYLVANAVPDARVVVDGPRCVEEKVPWVGGGHDFLSTLDVTGRPPRVRSTQTAPDRLALAREKEVLGVLATSATDANGGAVLVTSMPMALLTGMDVERLCRIVEEEQGVPLCPVTSRAMDGDWLDGYEESLLALARSFSGTGRPRVAGSVAIVGNLYDRNEEDQRANIRELRRLLAGLGLTTTSIWLEGTRYRDLAKAFEADTIIGLPYGLRAARHIARTSGAGLVETALPIGLRATEAWLRAVARATGREREAEGFIDHELARMVPRLERAVAVYLAGLRVGFLGDPYLCAGIADLLDSVDAELSFAVLTNRPAHTKGCLASLRASTRTVVYPRQGEVARIGPAIDEPRGVFIASSLGCTMLPQWPLIELGFPSFHTHCFHDRPCLGFNGAAVLVESLTNAAAARRRRRAES